MSPKSDARLLREYAENGGEAAFTEIVVRHTNLVYSAALRQLNSPDLAAEISQRVFIGLARGARSLWPRLAEDASLAGWLCRSARNLSLTHRRDELRRHSRERQAMEHNNPNLEIAPDWHQLSPLLDEAMSELNEPDYDAVVMRYFQNEDLRTVGLALGVSEDTAQKRVSRAVDHLRKFFSKHGVTVGASGLTVVVSTNAVHAAPASLATTIASASLASGATALTVGSTAAKAFAMTTFQKTLIAATVIAGATTTLLIQHQSRSALRDENHALRQQVERLNSENALLFGRATWAARSSLRLPAPPMPPATESVATSETSPVTNLLTWLEGSGPGRLTAEQAEAGLTQNRRNATSLLAAYRTTGDAALLEEAMRKFPDDPQVAFEAALRKEASPEQRRQWLDAFKRSAPENALPDYLSALDYFKSGQTDQAIAELEAASAKQQFHDYTLDRVQADGEAYRAAGYPEAETRMASTWGLMLPQLAELKQLGLSVVDLSNSYRQAGDETSATAALQMAINLAMHFDGSEGTAGVPLVTQMVGMAIERIALGNLDPASPYGSAGQTVKDRIDELAQRRAAIQSQVQRMAPLQPRMTPQDWIIYNDRTWMFGEENAIGWLLNKYPPTE